MNLSSAMFRPFVFSLSIAFGHAAGAVTPADQEFNQNLADRVIVVTKSGDVVLPDQISIEISKAGNSKVRFRPNPIELGLKDTLISCKRIRAYNSFSWFVSDQDILDDAKEVYGEDIAYILSHMRIQNDSNLSEEQVRKTIEKKVWSEVLVASKAAVQNADALCLNQG